MKKKSKQSKKEMETKSLLCILCYAGSKLFKYIDIYAPKDNVIAVTFSNSKRYANKIAKIETKKEEKC